MQTQLRSRYYTELGRIIEERHAKKGDLAGKAGVSPSHLTRALQLVRPIARRAVEVICVELGVELDAVYDGRGLIASPLIAVDDPTAVASTNDPAGAA